MFRNLLIKLEEEINELYSYNYNDGDWDKFIFKLNYILNIYKFIIYKYAKKNMCSKISPLKNNIELNDTENVFLNSYNFNDFLDKLKIGIIKLYKETDEKDLYNKIINIIIGECILIYKQFQILACKDLGIQYIKLIVDDNNSCEICQSLSKLIINIDNFDLNNIHPYCKCSIVPLNFDVTINKNSKICNIKNLPLALNDIDSLITKLQINYKKFITYKNIIFGEYKNINFIDDNIFISNDNITLSNLNLSNILIKGLLKDKFLSSINNKDKWQSLYNMKKDSKLIGDKCIIYSLPFISNIAQNNLDDYIMECLYLYIINRNELEIIDKSAFNLIKETLNN